MKHEYIYERRQSAGRMEVIMLLASGFGIVTAVLALLNYGWVPCFAMLLLSVIAYGLARVFDFLTDLLASVEPDEQTRPVAEKDAVRPQ
jgi:hypothetical protein